MKTDIQKYEDERRELIEWFKSLENYEMKKCRRKFIESEFPRLAKALEEYPLRGAIAFLE